MITGFKHITAAAVLALAALSTTARADSFVASPQDYPTPAAYAAAYAAAGQEQIELQDKVFNPNAYQCGAYCKANLVMTAIERKYVEDHVGGNAGGAPAASSSGH